MITSSIFFSELALICYLKEMTLPDVVEVPSGIRAVYLQYLAELSWI